jgi:hypothetical protein
MFKNYYIFIDMKTTILILATAIALTSCGGTTVETTPTVDSTLVKTDSICVMADSCTVSAPADSLKK